MPTTSQNTTGYRTFQATAAAIAAGARVQVNSSGLILVAAATDAAIGVAAEPIAASGYGTVQLFSAPGTLIMLAGGAITRGAQIFPTAAGKILATGTTALDIVALEAAAADGDQIECCRIQKGA
jgi:hypothetical protein